jgi:Zn-dependent M16 (insulinase) family peptidase
VTHLIYLLVLQLVAMSHSLELMETFYLSAVRQDVNIYKHASGIRVALCRIPGPLCQADIVIPTECENNSGLPHCLEHLVFMGSQRFPNRGFLDKLANLCIAQGTNAWTDRDHTAYNAVTAGPIGLQRLLPVLLDHVLSPTLTEEQFATEIFHVDGEGKAKGVVYCEMQGREATEDDLSDHHLHEMLYANSGYSFECGGLTPEIEKLSNDDVRKYHKRFYSPSNCLILVHGQVSPELLESALNEWMAHTDKRPPPHASANSDGMDLPQAWRHVPAPLSSSVSRTVEFATEDEDVGSVTLGWSGPPLGDVVTCTALEVLFRYLQDGAASPLAQHFVECPQPLASSVDFDLELRVRTCLTLSFSGVPNCAAGQADTEEEDEEDGSGGDSEGDGSEEHEDGDDGEGSDKEEEEEEEEGKGDEDSVLKEGVILGQLMEVLCCERV